PAAAPAPPAAPAAVRAGSARRTVQPIAAAASFGIHPAALQPELELATALGALDVQPAKAPPLKHRLTAECGDEGWQRLGVGHAAAEGEPAVTVEADLAQPQILHRLPRQGDQTVGEALRG